MVVNKAVKAAEPMFFAHSAVNLTDDYVYLWANTDGFVMPLSGKRRQGEAFLRETSVDGTYKLLWVMDPEEAEEQGLRKATINSRGRY